MIATVMSDDSGVHHCTPASPMPADAAGTWVHDAAVMLEQADGWPGGDIATYRCPACLLVFEQELPQ